ncbi:MAG: class II fumarate hydratase [Actinomycetota bacterium]|nr:class II fumarate hydratase [Actinomycetota bacterium]
MGEVQVPAHAYYGASTQRAVENFPISTLRFGRRFIWALGLIKSEAARVNQQLGMVADDVAQAVAAAADEVAEGRLDDQFVVDIFQTGSGTSTNMNANEVIANRAAELLGSRRGDGRVHPNDHVNPGQSSNDVIPSALHLAAVGLLREELIPSLERLATSLQHKAEEFDGVVKSGRTHLMDATPIRLGQEFGGYAAQVGKGAERLRRVLPELEELALGGTAVGTGLNAPEGFGGRVIECLARRTGYPLREAENHFEAQGAKDGVVSASGALRTVAVSLFKIANDLRWMASGPGAGIAEIRLPSLQPGSSIMPGKENPVICEAVMQLAAQVVGNDTAVVWGGANGNLELNVMMPVMAHNLLQSAELLASGAEVLRAKAVEGIEPDQDRCRELVERNVSIVTSLAPSIGYDQAAEIAKAALASGRSVRRVALEKGVLSAEELDEALDLRRMTEGGIL